MIFAQRYKDLIFENKLKVNDRICGDVIYNLRVKLVNIMSYFSEPMKLLTNRYNSNDIIETNALEYACNKFNDIMGIPYVRYNALEFSDRFNIDNNLANYCLSFIFSVVELQYENLSDKEKIAFSDALNDFFKEYDFRWRILDGKMIKIDAQQFECDLKAKAVEAMKELKDAEPKFQSAYTELTTAIEAFEKGDYQSAINNAGKSYESILKVILNADRGNADKLTTQYMNTFLKIPETMTNAGFREKVMMSLPYVRNNSGADHGAGAKEVVISKPMAKLAINLSASLNTYLIEEYADRIIQNPEVNVEGSE